MRHSENGLAMGVAIEGDLSVIDGATVDETTYVEKYRCDQRTVSIVVVGASGDLAKKKIFPALFALYYQGMLPEVRTSRYLITKCVTCDPSDCFSRTSRSSASHGVRCPMRLFGMPSSRH